MAKKKNSGPKKYRSAEPFKGYKKDWQQDSRTMTNAEYKGYMNTNPYQERPAQSLVQGNLIDYLMQKRKQREASEQNTKTWRDRTVSGQNSGNPYQSYQEKMKIDSHGGVSGGGLDYLQKEYEKEYKNKQAEQRTKAWQDMARTAPEMTYAMKMINDTAPSKEDQKDFGKDANQVRWDRFVNQMLGANYADVAKGIQSSKAKGGIQTEYDLYKEWKDAQQSGQQTGNGDIFGRITPQEYNQFRNWMIKNGATGMYDNGINPSLMTDKGLQSSINKWGNTAEELERQAEAKNQQMLSVQPGQMFGEVFDLVESIAQQQAKRAAMNGNNSQEEYAKNAAALDERRKTAEARKQDIVEKADNYFTNEYDRHLYDGDDQETTRAGVFDRIMQGEVTYDMLVKSLNPEQKAALDQRLDAVIDRANNYSAEDMTDRYVPEIGADLAMSNAYESYVRKGEAEQKRREKQQWYDNLVESKYVTESGTYDPSLIPEPRIINNDMYENYAEPRGTAIEKSYYWANHPDHAGIGETHKEYFMTPEQLDTFNRMYAHDKANGTNFAVNYLAGLDSYLSSCKVQYEEFHTRQTADVPGVGTVAHVVTFPVNVVNGMIGAGATLAARLGNKEAQDVSSDLYAGTRWIQNTRDERGNVVSDLAGQVFGQTGKDITKQLMNIADSIGDNLMAMATAGAATAGKLNTTLGKVMIQGIMSNEAMSNTMVQNLNKGMDPTKAAVLAIADGAIEAITEHFSLETILKPDVKGMLGNKAARRAYLAKSTIAEGSEELASGLLNTAFDTIVSAKYNDIPEMMQRYNELIVGQGMSDREATRQVLKEHWEQLGLETLAGALSGYAMAGGRYLTNKVTQSQTGEQISNQTGNEGINTLINQALEGNRNSEAYQQAEKLKTKLDNGQKITNREAGRLAQTLQAEASENIQNAIEAQQNPEKPGVAPSVIDRSMRTLESVAEVTGERARARTDEKQINLATEEEIKQAQGERISGNMEVIHDGKFAKIDGVQVVKDDNGQWQLKLKVNGQTVDADEVTATNNTTAKIIHQAANNPELYSKGYTELLLKMAEEGQISDGSVLGSLMDAKKIRLLAYAGIQPTNMPNTSLSQKAVNDIWAQSVEEHAKNRLAQVKDANRKNTGRVTFDGTEYGTEEWKAKISDLSENVRVWMDTIAGIAQRAGIEAEFKSLDNGKLYGWENQNGIGLNINGWNYTRNQNGRVVKTGVRHHMLVTFGHEMTHWLQRNSLQGYNHLEQYVLQEYAKKYSADQLMFRVEKHMDSQGLNLEDAISEIVADSCDQILSDESVMKHIQETDGKLYTAVKGFVKDLISRFKDAIRGMKESASKEGRDMAGKLNEIAKIWLGAYDEALTQVATAQTEYTEEDYKKSEALLEDAMENPMERFSFAEPVEMREDGLIAVHNLSIENLRDVLRMNGFPMPSIAVLSAEKVFQGYGGYEKASIFFGRDVVDPMLRSWNRIYNGDAYTPTFGSEQVDTADEGLQYLRKTWDRNLYQAYDMTNMFTDFKKVSNLEEAREKAYTYKQDMYEHNKERHAVRDMEKQIMKDARKLLADVYGERYSEKDTAINHWIARGVLYAAEQMEQLGELSKTAQYEILQENIDKSFEEGHISYKADFGINGTDIYDQMLKFIEAASKLEHSAMWLEAKPDGIVGIPEIQTILLPEKVKNTDIPQQLENAGLDPERIRYYDSPLGMEEGSLYYESQQIPQYVPGTRFSQAETENGYKNTEGVNGVPNALRTGKMGNNNPSVINSVADAVTVVNNDEAYRAAVERGDLAAAISMVMEKLKSVDGVIPFMAPNWHSGEDQKIAENLKKNDPEAIRKAADAMAKLVPDNAVLIPMPGSNGRVEKGSWTMNLTNRISEITGRPAVVALEGNEHESRQKAKQKGETGPLQEELGFRKIAEIPEGTIPIFIDNTVGSGVTADAARVAMGGGMTLAYTKTLLSKGIPGLKNAVVTYASKKDGGALIPLSQRFNVSRRDVRYSSAEVDDQYMQAVESGDVELQRKLVQQASIQNGFTEVWAHGTPTAIFTSFDLTKAKGAKAVFLSDPGTASNYAGTSYRQFTTDRIGKTIETVDEALQEIRRISDGWHQPKKTDSGYRMTAEPGVRPFQWNYTDEELIEYANNLREQKNGGVYNLFVNPGNSLKVDAKGAWWNQINSKYGSTTDQIGKWALEHGYDSVEINNVHDGGSNDAIPSDILLVFDGNRLKTAELVTYDDQGNVIPLSERFNIENNDIRWSQAETDDQYMQTVESGNMAAAQEMVYEAGRRAGWAIKAHHGTQRGDRVGNVFRPDRATSGPMAFFTDNREIAENYARDKRDTSIDYDPDYHEEGWEDYDIQFKVKDKNGKYVPVRTLWDKMSYAQKQKFIENAKHITTNDDGEIIFDKDTDNGLGNYDAYTLREYKGNGIDALVYSWLKAGELLGDEGTFIKVLEMAGIKDAKWFNPNESHEKVYDVLLNIQNPFDTGSMYTPDFLEELSSWYFGEQGHSYEEEPEGVTNMWDKKGTTVWKWIQYGWDDMRVKGTGNWTRIPDGVTDFLKYKGYDGIKDTGGKGGGQTHTVWIPFSSEQVKSADPVTYDDQGNVIPLSERFDKSKVDIRWSQAETDNDPRQQELSEAWQKARDEVNDLREQVRNKKPEVDAWVDKMSESMKNGTENEVMAEYKEWEKGYVKLQEQLHEAEQRYKEANRAFDDYVEERDVAEEQRKIKASGLSEADYRRKQAVKEFGYTTDFREAGYLLPNGKMLNFTGEKGKHYGTRGEDHRGIGRIYASRENQGGAAMMAFMRDGNIRVMAETPGIDLITTIEPTAEQYEQIRNMARRFAGEHYFNVDLTDERGYTDDSIEYDGRVDPNRVVNDIKSFYKTGVVPQQSVVNQFHYSQWSEEGMDVNQWMMSQTPGSLQTEDEAALVQAYKDLRIKLALSTHRIEQYEQRIKRLEAKADLTAEERDELMANRNRLEIQRKKMADLEDELYRVTSTDGYAGMMYRQNMVLKDYIQGKTQDQVRQTVEEMQKQVQKAQEQIRKDIEDLKQLGNTQAVKTMKSFMGKTSLSRMASLLRKNYNSSLSKAEIEDRLAEMALKQQSGQDITTETEALAQDLLDRMRGVRSDALEYLRGATLRIGDDMLTEYVKERKIDQQVKKGKDATDERVMRRAKQIALREMKEQIKGSGVKLIAEEGSSSFVQQWNELREKNGGLKDLTGVLNEMHGLHEVLDYIQEEVENSQGIKQNDVNFDEVALVVRAAVGNVTTYLSGDPEARKQINNLMGQIAELSGRTEEIADRMEDLNRQMDDVVLAGQKAKGWTTVLQRDVKEAIKYYNKTAKVAAENERTKVRKQLIEQLRSENTRKLIEQEEKFKERLKNDKTARELANDNLMLRRKITTVTKRLATLLTKETDLKNIPEKAKPLARQMIRMIVNHDLSYRMITFGGREGLSSVIKTLDILDAREGKFRDEDLDWLIRGEGETADYDVRDAVILALIDIESGLMEYRNAEGRGNTSLLDRKNALAKVQKATATIYNVIHASQVAEINGRQMMVMDLALDTLSDMGSSRFKGEHTGWFGRKIGAVRSGIGYKNMTPEYFIKNLKNKTLSRMYDEYHQAENKAGLMYGQAQKILQQIAKDAGYDTWDQKKKYTIKLEKGGKVELNLEQMMQIYATWKREATLQAEIGVPEKTYHLTTGGFYVEQEAKHKINGREFFNNRAQKITEEDFYQIQNLLTDEQKRYVDQIVQYMSDDMSRLGNEASMRMYGIKKYNEKYYFPFEIWNGVKSVKSDAGAGGNTESHRGAHPSFSNRLRNNASNALMIRGFTKMAAKHIVQMINYNTFAPAIENLQRVMNSQVTTGEEDNLTARNLWAAFGERYGKDALNYLQDFQKAINGGVNQYENTIYDKLLSIFKKNAVAGSLSVAAQQPLSYIRAAMMISPKYLTLAMNPATYKGSMDEMMKYSGVAVIKNMGKFDMNFGQSAQDYITPEAQKGKAKAAYDWISDKSTILPQMMDAVTWTRMWTAAKLEQQALNPEMDHKSDEFMNKVAERFNEIMRMTQVYDSVMVKSPNLRSQNPWVKTFTSFMAEPTLSANVLVDAAVNFKEKGGKKHLVKALATFMASAAAQAAAKGFFGAGRSPDDRKNREENFLYKFWYNLLSEINPLGLIPGYNDVIEALTKGELKDDAMGIIGKVPQIVGNMLNLFKESGGTYRDIEESLGQIIQLTTNVPAKNLMRDFRAMVTFFGGGQLLGAKTYANRPTSGDVLKYQMQDMFMTNDLVGMINTWLGDKGYDSSNSAYYNRIYEAEKAGDTQAAEEMKEYLRKGRNTKEDKITEGIQKAVKADDSMSAAEQTEWMIKEGLTDNTGTVTQQYRDGKISRKEATQLLKQMNPELSDDDIWWKLDLIDYKNETGKKDVSGKYYRLTDAINANKADQITSAVNDLLKHGYTKEQIKDKLSGWKKEYLAADSKERVRIRDAITKAYKAAGYTVDDANKTIEKWTKEKKKK